MGDAAEIHVHKNILIHHYPLVLFPWPSNPLRQALLFELEAYRVNPGVGQVGETISHTQYKQDDGIASNRNAGLAFFDLDQCRPAYGRPLCGDFCGNPPPPPRVPYIVAELAQGARDGNGEHP
jgi:hypothetical protein